MDPDEPFPWSDAQIDAADFAPLLADGLALAQEAGLIEGWDVSGGGVEIIGSRHSGDCYFGLASSGWGDRSARIRVDSIMVWTRFNNGFELAHMH